MLYSVWDHADRVYDYYQTAEKDAATSAPKPAHLRAPTLGVIPEKAAWPLPKNAVKVGRGKYPKGFIASRMSSPAFPSLGDTKVLGGAGLGLLLWVAAGYGVYKVYEGMMK